MNWVKDERDRRARNASPGSMDDVQSRSYGLGALRGAGTDGLRRKSLAVLDMDKARLRAALSDRGGTA